jgi:hypothetical protein
MTAIRPTAPALRVRSAAAAPRAAVMPAVDTAIAKPVAKPVSRPMPAVKPAATPEAGTVGTVGGLAVGGVVGWLFGSVLASGGLSGLLPLALAAGTGALFARGGAVIAKAIAGKAEKPTLAQGLVGGAAGLTLGAGIWGVTAFAGGMAMVPWVFAAAIPMGIAAAVLGGTAIGSFVPGRK